MDKNAIHDLEEILAERRVTLVRATILDRDNQPLATGTGVVRSEGVIPPHDAVEPMPVSEVDALIRNDFIKNL